MKLKDLLKKSQGEKVSLVTNNSDYFLFYQENSEASTGEKMFVLEKVSDLTKCATQGVVYHFKDVEEAESWLTTNYAEFDEY